eukprot:108832_1
MSDQIDAQKSNKTYVTTKYSTQITFLHPADRKQFLMYFRCIEKTELVKLLSIPLDITRTIAQYATGTIVKCANDGCNTGICVLMEHMSDFNNNKPVKWNYCANTQKYFCELCLPFTTNFFCCDTIQCFKHYKKCVGINKNEKYKTLCYDDIAVEYVMGYKCLYCKEGGSCEMCGIWVCSAHYRKDFKKRHIGHKMHCGGKYECCSVCFYDELDAKR